MKSYFNKYVLHISAFFFCLFMLQNAQGQIDSTEFKVRGACGMCEDRIELHANLVKGVILADWDWSGEMLKVIYDTEKFEVEKLHKRMAAVGHETDLVAANPAAYENLPACCHYKEERVTLNHEQIELDDKSPIFGNVFEVNEAGEETPIFGANIFWLGTNEGTVSDQFGIFVLPRSSASNQIVVSYIGFGTDTISGPFQGDLKVQIQNNVLMQEVEIVHRKKSIEISYLNPLKVDNISEKELLKAACCNLSESFETNPTVDVGFTDAVTGTRQISMLGLSGPYVQIMRENIPDIRGLSALSGFTYTPGPWVESIQLNKGIGSVVNGFESMTGQINVELRKPEEGERMYLNAYGNQGGRYEANANLRSSLSEEAHVGLLLHASSSQQKFDRNEDGFLDNPLQTNLIAINRWKFILPNGFRMQMGIKGTLTDQVSGQLEFDKKEGNGIDQYWGATNDTKRGEAWMKIGKVFNGKPYKSVGLQISGVYHDQQTKFGLKNYDSSQKSGYINLIYQSIIGNTDHAFKTGLSNYYDVIDEKINFNGFVRDEIVTGAFFEYTYTYLTKFSLVTGLRVDHSNYTGVFVTPRAHIRYAPNELTVLRASFGRGRRTASIFAENIGLFATAREIVIDGENTATGGQTNPYGLKPEVVWNGGINLTQGFSFWGRSMVLGLDFYRTVFNDQVIVDFDLHPQQVHFYDLNREDFSGSSYSNSIQIQLDYELLPKMDLRLAYRINDVKSDFKEGFLTKPLVSRERAFMNIGYETNNAWKFDVTLNWQGKKRLPGTAENPLLYRIDEFAPSFIIMNAQISKSFGEHVELYAGGENLTDFRQSNPILASEDPFGPFFDASMVWGPIFGRNIYVGARYRVQ